MHTIQNFTNNILVPFLEPRGKLETATGRFLSLVSFLMMIHSHSAL
jgi:hypothetical protein